jgi:hypothetical protein
MTSKSPSTASSRSSTRTTTPSPYLRAFPPEADVEEDPLRLRLDFHRESVILHDYGGSVVRTRLVSALDVAHALARELDLATGLLPPDTLWWSRTSNGVRIAVWREPKVWTVRLREHFDAKPRRLRLPMSGLVFIAMPARQAPYVFAARSRPRAADEQLYHFPGFNVFPSGRICPGTHLFPSDPSKVPESFFESHFAAGETGRTRSQRYPEDVGALWNELNGCPAFPLEDLVPAVRVADALRIGE